MAPSKKPEPDGPEPVRIVAREVSVRRRRTWLLPPTTLEVVSGAVTLAVGEPDDRHRFLALAVAGRLSGYDGEVGIDGEHDQRRLQREVVLVDLEGVTSPEPVLPVHTVVAEELALAGRRAWRRNVDDWLGSFDGDVDGSDLIGDIDPVVRVPLLTELAMLRDPGFVVLALPERHGALPRGWWRTAQDVARRGPGVLVTASPTAAAHVSGAGRHASIGPATAVPTEPAPTEPAPIEKGARS